MLLTMRADQSIPQFQHPIAAPIIGGRRGDAVAGDALHQHVAPMSGGFRPHRNRAVFRLAPDRDIFRRGRRHRAHALAEALVIECLAAGHVGGVRISEAGQHGAGRQRRQLMLRAEGVEVEGRGGGGHRSESGHHPKNLSEKNLTNIFKHV
jgi:hypothetical protein